MGLQPLDMDLGPALLDATQDGFRPVAVFRIPEASGPGVPPASKDLAKHIETERDPAPRQQPLEESGAAIGRRMVFGCVEQTAHCPSSLVDPAEPVQARAM